MTGLPTPRQHLEGSPDIMWPSVANDQDLQEKSAVDADKPTWPEAEFVETHHWPTAEDTKTAELQYAREDLEQILKMGQLVAEKMTKQPETNRPSDVKKEPVSSSTAEQTADVPRPANDEAPAAKRKETKEKETKEVDKAEAALAGLHRRIDSLVDDLSATPGLTRAAQKLRNAGDRIKQNGLEKPQSMDIIIQTAMSTASIQKTTWKSDAHFQMFIYPQRTFSITNAEVTSEALRAAQSAGLEAQFEEMRSNQASLDEMNYLINRSYKDVGEYGERQVQAFMNSWQQRLNKAHSADGVKQLVSAAKKEFTVVYANLLAKQLDEYKTAVNKLPGPDEPMPENDIYGKPTGRMLDGQAAKHERQHQVALLDYNVGMWGHASYKAMDDARTIAANRVLRAKQLAYTDRELKNKFATIVTNSQSAVKAIIFRDIRNYLLDRYEKQGAPLPATPNVVAPDNSELRSVWDKAQEFKRAYKEENAKDIPAKKLFRDLQRAFHTDTGNGTSAQLTYINDVFQPHQKGAQQPWKE